MEAQKLIKGDALLNTQAKQERVGRLRAIIEINREHLQETDLAGADLESAQLVQAKFTGADLEKIHLFGADLSRADLRGAELQADLSEADLRGADLRGDLKAVLDGRPKAADDPLNLRGAKVEGAKVEGAKVSSIDDFNRAVLGHAEGRLVEIPK